jgi:hypothetical protein
MAERSEIESTLASLLDAGRIRDYGPNRHGFPGPDVGEPA